MASSSASPDSGQITVRVLFFSVLREKLGAEALTRTLEAPATGADLLRALEGEFPALSAYRPAVRLAINESYAPDDAPLSDGDEVALITPVSGGQVWRKGRVEV